MINLRDVFSNAILKYHADDNRHRMISIRTIYLSIALLLCICMNGMAQSSDTIINSGTWTCPLGVTTITVEVWGAGGGGAGAYTTASGGIGGGGGGGGGYTVNASVPVVPGAVYNISIGNGGTSGNGGLNNGTSGGPGDSTYAVFGSTTVTAAGGLGGVCDIASAFGGAGGIGGNYNGGKGADGFTTALIGSGSGGGGGSSGGAGSNGNDGKKTNAGAAVSNGGAGGAGGGLAAGTVGGIPGGGGGGGGWWALSFGGAAGGSGQVVITYTVRPTCTIPCSGWIIQDCSTCPLGCDFDAGAIATPTPVIQTASVTRDTSDFSYIFWSFIATAGTTYYFDLCSSVGTSGASWLRLHRARFTGNNFCMDTNNVPTKVIENMANGCAGTGSGLSQLIWTCQVSGVYYLESADGASMTPWGTTGTETAVLSYKTIPSFSRTCSDVFYDKGIDGTNGSSADYGNNEDWIYTYYPLDTVTDAINVQFVNFSTAPGDILCVYNGNNINAPIIGCYAGPSITGAFSSTANDGSLTFEFTSDDNGTSSGWQANISCVASLGVRNNVSAGRLSIYPNPAANELWVMGYGLWVGGKTRVEIVNVVGERVYSDQLTTHNSQPQTRIDISGLKPGIYFVEVSNGDNVYRAKFVKE